MGKQKMWLFIFLGGLMVIGIGFTVYLAFLPSNNSKDNLQSAPSSQPSVPKEIPATFQPKVVKVEKETNQEVKQAPAREKKTKADEIYQKPSENKTMMDDALETSYEITARNKFRSFDFNGGVTYLSEQLSKYSEEGSAKTLYTLLNDATIITNFSHSQIEGEEVNNNGEGHVSNDNTIKMLLQRIQDPEMALLGVLSMDFNGRSNFILSAESLNPIIDGEISVESVTEGSGELLKDLSTQYDGLTAIKQIAFTVDGYKLYGYVLQFKEGYARLHSITEATEGSTPYKTIQEWNKILKKEIPTNTPSSLKAEVKK